MNTRCTDDMDGDDVGRWLPESPRCQSINFFIFLSLKKIQGDPKKTEPIQILLNPININRISRNLVDLNINICNIITQSFSYFDCFTLKLCTVQNMLQMSATVLEANFWKK